MDDKTRKVKKVITDPKMITPTGKFNVTTPSTTSLLIRRKSGGGHGRPLFFARAAYGSLKAIWPRARNIPANSARSGARAMSDSTSSPGLFGACGGP
jgi:hypothetical protein